MPSSAKSSAYKTTSVNKGKIIPVKYLKVFLAVIALLLYANTINHDYTVDDGTVIQNNKFTKMGVSGIGKIFTSPYRAGFWDRKEGLYRPVSVAMFAMEWQLAPNKAWPGHLINILLYAITVMLLFTLLLKVTGEENVMIAFLSALFFTVHPIHTEVVANIKSRDEILSLLFGILATLGAFHYIKHKNILLYTLSVISLGVALLSKENSIAWAGAIPLLLWCGTKVDFKKIAIITLPYIAVSALCLFIRFSVLGSQTGYELLLINNSLIAAPDSISRIATAVSIIGRYLWLMLFPVNLVFDYSYNTIPVVSFSDLSALASLVICLLLIYIAFKNLIKRSALSAGILFFFGTILLASNIFFLIESTMAERFIFTPGVGIAVALVAGLSFAANKKGGLKGPVTVTAIRSNSVLMIPFFLLCGWYVIRTLQRNGDWKNNLTLLAHDVKLSPGSARIRYAYGSALLFEKALKEKNPSAKQNELDLAIENLEKGVSIIPEYSDAWFNLGLAYKEKDDALHAVNAFERARGYREFKDADHFASAGIAYGMAGLYDKSLLDLRKALSIDSTDADTWNSYALYLGESGQMDASMQAFDKALSLRKNFDKAYYNRGNIKAKGNKFREAIEDYKISLAIDPAMTDAWNNMGNCYAALNRPDSAKVNFEKTLQLDPENKKATFNLGITLKILGDSAGGEALMNKASAL